METIILTEEKIKEIAEKYEAAEDQFHLIEDKDLHRFRKLIIRQFNYLSKFIYVDFVDYDPYGYTTIDEVLKDFNNHTIKVNTSGNNSRIWLTVYNLFFRSIHDYIHCKDHLNFTAQDELKAYYSQTAFSRMFGDTYKNFLTNKEWELYDAILRSEIVYQGVWKEHFDKFHLPLQKIVLDNLID